MMSNEITQEQLQEYCKKRDLVIVDNGLFQKMKRGWTWTKDPTQAYIEDVHAYKVKIDMQRQEIAMFKAILSDTIKQANKDKFRYDNIRSLLNLYISTGLMPGYFDIYNDLQDTKHKLKDARKEAAAANKRYKQLKKEFAQYRNKHTDSDCNPYIAKIRDLEQQIQALHVNLKRLKEESNG